MKTAFLFLFVFCTGIAHAQQVFDPGALDEIAREDRRRASLSFDSRGPETGGNYDVTWYGCDWRIDPAVRAIAGSVVMAYRPLSLITDTLRLDLYRDLAVDSVTRFGEQVGWRHTGDILAIGLPVAVAAGQADSVRIFYHGTPPDNGFGAFTRDWHNGIPIVWTLSEPYGASDWWPCKNGLTDKADSVDILLRVPAGNRAASNGILVSEVPSGAERVYHWKHRYPIAAYLVCLAVTNYARYTHYVPFEGDTLPVENYVYPEDSATVAQQTAVIVPLIQVFDTLFGVYPFQEEKYGHAQFGWGGGMEHQTMTFMGSFGYELQAHELAHMWFGNKVTCGSWADIWLNEGFATYLSGISYERLLPQFWQRFREVRVKSIVSKPGGSVWCDDTTSVSRIFDSRLSYAKGAMILHQLRWLMGDPAFFTALNNYLSDPAIAYGFARTPQLKAHLEATSGLDLTGYFDDWFTGQGYPSYQVNWWQEGDTVTFTVSQTTSHPSVGFFEMPIPVAFKNTARDTILRFDHTVNGQVFKAHIPFPVDSVLFDPEYQLISGGNIVSGMREAGSSTGVTVFPNPAEGVITIRTASTAFRNNRILTITGLDGSTVAEHAVEPGRTDITIRVAGLPPGAYLFRLSGPTPSTGIFIVRKPD